jgi:1,4-dihydroxy-2-naphthoate octaprenyltransferase
MRGWLTMARIPFHSVGAMPFILGAVLAWRLDNAFSLPVFSLSILAVVLIMLTTYSAGEFYDLEGDRLTARLEKNFFSGGSQAVVKGMIPPAYAKVTSYIAALCACVIGLVLQFHYHTGPWTIPLGLIGLSAGFFYSTEPVRLVKRGVGEVIIGFCYGWLPIAAAYYLQTSHLTPLVHWMSIPVGLTIFNVILINEYPDYPADVIEGKANLVVRLGKETCSIIYAAAGLATLTTFSLAVLAGAPAITWAFVPVIAVLSLYPSWAMIRGEYMNRQKLERMCAMTLALNLLTAAAFIAGLLL